VVYAEAQVEKPQKLEELIMAQIQVEVVVVQNQEEVTVDQELEEVVVV
jgi:hypothetical protein